VAATFPLYQFSTLQCLESTVMLQSARNCLMLLKTANHLSGGLRQVDCRVVSRWQRVGGRGLRIQLCSLVLPDLHFSHSYLRLG